MDKFVALYCKEQNAFHVESLNSMIESNYKLIREGSYFPQYIAFSLSDSIDDAVKSCNQMREFTNA